MTSPVVSVVLPVRNGEKYISSSVSSILAQEWGDFELLVVDDGSEDETLRVLSEFGDSRLKVVSNEGQGLVTALRYGIKMSSGAFVARMDSDDVALPRRLSAQLDVLRSEAQVGLVCSDVLIMDEGDRIVGKQTEKRTSSEDFLRGLLFRQRMRPIIHPSVMFRRETYDRSGGYREFHRAEDHDLWLRMLALCDFRRISEPLLIYRVNPEGVSRTGAEEQLTSSAVSAINWLICAETGVDIHNCDCALQNWIWKETHHRLSQRAFGQAALFQEIRGGIRSRNLSSIAGAVATGASKHRTLPHPDAARRSTRLVIDEMVFKVKDRLAMRGESRDANP